MITCRLILNIIAERHDFTVGDLLSGSKRRALKDPRHMAWKLARSLTPLSYPMIGRQMGWRDHTTIISGIKSIDRILDADPAVLQRYSEIKAAIFDAADAISLVDPVAVAERALSGGAAPVLSPAEILILSLRVVETDVAGETKAAETLAAETSAAPALPLLGQQQIAAAAAVARAYQTLQIRRWTICEADARRALEGSLKTLSPLFQKET